MENQNELPQTSSQSTTPQPPNLPSQPLPENKPHSSFLTSKLFLITLVILTLFTLVYTGIYLSLNSKLNQITKSNLPPTTPPSASPAPNGDRANWKTYSNTKYNYQFKYPDKDWSFDWLVPPNPNEDIRTFDSISFLKTTTVPNKYVNQSIWWMRFFVSVQPNPNQLTPKELYYFRQYTKDIPAGLLTNVPFGDQYLKDLRNKVSREAKYPEGVEDTTFLDYAALRETYKNWGSLTLAKDSLTFVMSWNIEDGKETAENAQQIFNQILSTFRFTN